MDKNAYEAALVAAGKLEDASDDALFEELGLRIKDRDLPGGEERSQTFDGPFAADAESMGLGVQELRRIGRLWWENLEPQLMAMVCRRDNDDVKAVTGGKSIPQVAAGLAAVGVATAFAPPAWAIVVTTILATKIVESGLDAVCRVWGEGAGQQKT